MALDPDDLFRLIELRRQQAEQALGAAVSVTSDYAHFHAPRGFGVTFIEGKTCHMRFAQKCLHAPLHRVDAVIRHELGHVLDTQVPVAKLDRWARARGVTLASTPERRADDIALVIWGVPLRYDNATVQSTCVGRVGRPAHLSQ